MFDLIVRRPVAVSMLSLAMALFGLLAYQQLPVALMPSLNYPTLTIQTLYDGAAPQEVESELTDPIEERLSTVENLSSIRSRSKAGVSEIQLELRWGINLNHTLQRVYERLDRLQLPKGVDPPQVLRYDPTLEPMMVLALTTEKNQSLVALRKYAEEVLTPMLHQVAGVAAVKVLGGDQAQIDVDLHDDAMKRYGLTVAEVADKIKASHVNLAGGQLVTEQGQILLRTLSELTSLEDLQDVLIYQKDQTWVKLKDIADVKLGVQEKKAWVQVGQTEAVRVQIYRQAESNLVAVAQKLRQYLFQPKRVTKKDITRGNRWKKGKKDKNAKKRDKKKSHGKDQSNDQKLLTAQDFRSTEALSLQIAHPKGVKAYLIHDQSRFIEDALSAVNQAILVGGFLAILILFLFLRSLYHTLVVAIAIPLSVILCFIPLHFLGVSLNLMSLGGLALGVGMLVDNAVVVLESISRVREHAPHQNYITSAIQGVREVAGAVIASTLTTVAVFAPVAFIDGLAGQVFKDLALTVVAALIASLLVALIVVPMLCGRTWNIEKLNTTPWLVSHHRSEQTHIIKRIWYTLHPLPMNQLTRAWRIWKQVSWIKKIVYLFCWPIPVIEFLLMWLANAMIATCMMILMICFIPYKVVQVILYSPLRWASSSISVLLGKLENVYTKTLSKTLARPSIILIITAVLLWFAVSLLPKIPKALLPEVAQGILLAEFEYPVGSTLESTHTHLQGWIDKLSQDTKIQRVELLIGQDEEDEQGGESRGPHQARLTLNLASRALESEVSHQLRQWALDEAGLTLQIKRPSLLTLKPPIRVVIRGNDLNLLKSSEQKIYQEMQSLSQLSDIEQTFRQAYPEIKLEYDYARLAMLGLSPLSVAQQLRDQLKGYEALEVLWGGNKLPIVLRKEGALLSREKDLPHVLIQGQQSIPLSSIATFKMGEGPSEIRHVDGQRAAEISAYVSAFDLGNQSQKVNQVLHTLNLSPQVEANLSGQDVEMQSSLQQLSVILLLSLFLIYVVMATQFESIGLPLLIMGAVPLASIGVFITLWQSHTPLSIVVFVGFITLSGIVVNNAIVYLDAAHKKVAQGVSKVNALLEAGQQRLRPILMTTLSTLIGLLPMLSPIGEGAELRIPLALTLMGGLLSSTILVLYVLPVLYRIFAIQK